MVQGKNLNGVWFGLVHWVQLGVAQVNLLISDPKFVVGKEFFSTH